MWAWVLAAAALVAAFFVYSPALSGPFVLDDLYLPFTDVDAATMPLRAWFGGQRPLLMLTYWLNYQGSGNTDPWAYHAFNVLLHWVTAALVFLIARKLLERAETDETRRTGLAAFAAGLFLLHPVQSEAVAYVASRSDVLSALFCCAAMLVFVRARESGVTWPSAATILALFVCGVLSKEQAAVLPAAFLAIDLVLDGFAAVKRNARLHGPVLAAGLAGGAYVISRLLESDTAGFSLAGMTWRDYFFTQCRVVWRYAGLFLLPSDLNLDTDFPLSRSLGDHGAWIGLVGIVAAIGAAWMLRVRFALAALGVLLFVIFLAPTSSFIPIRDVVAERRVYLPMLGLALVATDLVRRLKLDRGVLFTACGVLIAALAFATHSRAAAWSGDIPLWEDTAAKSPRKVRPRFHLADAYYHNGRFADANREFAAAAAIEPPEARLLANWALSLDQVGDAGGALDKLTRAILLGDTAHLRATMGMVLGKQGRMPEALAALGEAEKLDPKFAPTYSYRGNVYSVQGDWPKAVQEYRKALALDPANAAARRGIQMGREQGVQ